MVRDSRLYIRLTDAERERLARAAWAAGRTISDYVRQSLGLPIRAKRIAEDALPAFPDLPPEDDHGA